MVAVGTLNDDENKGKKIDSLKQKMKSAKKSASKKSLKSLSTKEEEVSEEEMGMVLEICVSNFHSNGKDHAFLGRCFVHIEKMEDLYQKKPVRAWYALAPQPKGKFLKPDAEKYGEVELLLKWAYNPDVDFSDMEVLHIINAHHFNCLPSILIKYISMCICQCTPSRLYCICVYIKRSTFDLLLLLLCIILSIFSNRPRTLSNKICLNL
jgi:hypothetical protein